MKIRKEQLHDSVFADRYLLRKDIEDHLDEYRPDLKGAYPRPYFLWVIDDSIEIASRFRIDDVYSMRLFVRLRWDIAPGFYKQKEIAKILNQKDRSAENRFQELTTDSFAQAWEEAEQFDGPEEWREHYWEVEE